MVLIGLLKLKEKLNSQRNQLLILLVEVEEVVAGVLEIQRLGVNGSQLMIHIVKE